MKIREIVKMEKELNEFKSDLIKVMMDVLVTNRHKVEELVRCDEFIDMECELEDQFEDVEFYKIQIIKDIAKKYYDMRDEVDKWLSKEVE